MTTSTTPAAPTFSLWETAVAATALSHRYYHLLLKSAVPARAPAAILRDALAEAVADDLGGSHPLTYALLTHALDRIDYDELAEFFRS